MMMMMARGLRCLVLESLLDLSEVLLRPGDVSGLQILRQLVERLCDRAIALCRRSGTALRPKLLQGHEVGLGGRQVAGLQILAELLELFLKLLHLVLDRLISKQIAAGNS